MTSIYPTSNTSNTSSNNSSTSSANLLRIPGMASGIDTDSVVKAMTSNYQNRIDKANQAKQTLQWKQEAYRDIIKSIKGLQDYFDPISSKYILGGDTMNVNSASSDTASIASATAQSGAKNGTYKVHVDQLAEEAKITSSSSLYSLVSIVNGSSTDTSKWAGAKLNLDSNIKLGAVTDTTSIVDGINNNISSDPTLKGKIVASYDSTNHSIKFQNISGSDIVLNPNSLGSPQTISAYSSVEVDATNPTDWSNANLTFTNSVTLDSSIPDANGSGGLDTADIAADINNKISQNSFLSGKVSAAYVNDGNGNTYIKFTSAGSANLTATSASGTSGDIVSNKNVNSGVSSSMSLSSFGVANASGFTLSYGSTSAQISVSSTDTLQTLIDQVNSKTSGAVTMSIDDNTGIISFKSKDAGSSSTIGINNLTGDINKLGIAQASKAGKDAIVEITEPGQSVATTTTQSSNNFTVNGVSYNIVGASAAGTNANITVTSNTDNVVDNFKKFVDDYNSVISTINTKLTEKKDKDYQPLTDAQKQSMSEAQINAWEAKAKVGILRNDDYLSSLMTDIRGVFSSAVYSNYDSTNISTGKIPLTFGKYGTNAIGIDTSSDYTDGGKLIISDQATLTDTIKNHLDDFKKLFIGKSDADLGSNQAYVGSEKYHEDGIFTRMDNILRDYVAAPGIGEDGTYSLSGKMNIFVNKQYDYTTSGTSSKNTLPDQVYEQAVSISKYQTQLKDAQTRYYAKFTALETAMSQLNAQQSQLSSMLGTNA